MMSVIRAVLLDPLPYRAPDSLVWVYTDNPPFHFRFSVVDYRALEADHPAFSEIAAYQTSLVTVTDGGTAERVTARAVTGSYFPLLGQTPHLGRLFDVSDDARADRMAVLTHVYWTQHFGGDPSVLGRAITVDGASYTIQGVLQEAVGPFEQNTAIFTVAHWPAPARKGPFFIMALGRLRPDISRAAAVESLHATTARLFPIWKSSYQDEKATWGIQDLKERVVGTVGSSLLFVLAAVGAVLLIACANAVNLLIARSLSRSRELAIRGALGASRGRIVQQLLVETGVVTAGSALVGLAVAFGVILLVTTYGVGYLPRLGEIRLWGVMLAWLGLASGVLIGLVPAIHSAQLRMNRVLASSGRAHTDGSGARRLRRALVAGEFALATPLLVAAALVLASLDRLAHVDVGIETEHLLTASVTLPGARYPQSSDRQAFWDRAVERLTALPGVEAVALADSRPPVEASNTNNFDLEDHPTPAGQNQPLCRWVAASSTFFQAVGLRLERGRLFDERDRQPNAPPVIIVDTAWASRFFRGEDVLGRRLREGGCTSCPWTTVVGVTSAVKFNGLNAPDDGVVYTPFVTGASGFVVLRASRDPASLTSGLRQTVRQLDPGLALSGIATGDELVSTSLAQPRYLGVLIGMFALTAVVLSIVGIYGVMTHFVQQHTRDIGIRLALGGEPSAMRRMVVVRGLRLVVAGVGLGMGGALLGARLMTAVLFGVSPTDLPTMVAVPGALLAVAAIACLVPAGRAARLDPAAILRES
jgi:predicted permease